MARRFAVGVDVRGGRVAVEGWLETSALSGPDFCRSLAARGVRCVIYTDIGRDGALRGANLDAYRALLGIEGLSVIASGGVTSEADLQALHDMGVHGAIVGRALYEGRLDLPRALRLPVRRGGARMITRRIIPCLDVRDGRVVKGRNFQGLADVEDPVALARFYNASGADELVFYDITASAEGRALFTDVLERVAREIFIR